MKFSWKVHFNQGTNNYLDLKIDYSNIHTVKKANNFGFFFFRFENWKIEAAFGWEKIASNVGNIWNVWKPNNPLYKMGFKPTSKNRSIQGVQNKIPSFRIFFFKKENIIFYTLFWSFFCLVLNYYSIYISYISCRVNSVQWKQA